MRVRTPDLREAIWTFTAQSGVNIFPGQIVSAVARPMKDDFSEFLASYNHNTREVVAAGGLDNANRAGGFLAFLAQPASCIAGTLGFLIVICYFLTTPPYIFQFGLDMGGFVVLLFSAFCSLTVAFFLTHWLTHKVVQKRALFLSESTVRNARQFFRAKHARRCRSVLAGNSFAIGFNAMIEFSIMFGPASGVILANAFLTKEEKTVRRALFAAARQLVVPFRACRG